MLRYILLAIVAMIGTAMPAQAQSVDRVKCESRNNRPNACPAYNARDVRLAQQLGGRCLPGNDWNFDGRNINVRNGCRALFDVFAINNGGGWGPGPGPGGGGTMVIRCQSENGRYVRCPVDARGGAQLVRQLNNTPCIEGRSWGRDRDGIWVNNGCRGEFAVRGGNDGNWGNPGGGYGQVVECSSRNYRPQRCNVPIRTTVQIERVLGGECIQGRTWGYDRGGIWVNNGCRARFRVY